MSKNKEKEKRPYNKDSLSLVRRYLSILPPNYIFTTRELLTLVEERPSLDSFLCTAVKVGYIERLARGVFRRKIRGLKPVPEEVIVGIKRVAFAGRVSTTKLSREEQRKEARNFLLGNPVDSSRCVEFLCVSSGGRFKAEQEIRDRKTSSIYLREADINIVAIGNRKSRLGETEAGRKFRTIWLRGEKYCSEEEIYKTFLSLSPKERLVVPSLKQFLPQWISDCLPRLPYESLQVLIDRVKTRKAGLTGKYRVPGSRIFA